jgi:F-type H+-transporting ATPase subunit gamma
VIASLYSPDLAEQFPLLRQPARVRRAAVILLTGNRGLAGAFNANLIKEARATIARLESEGVTVDLHAVGRKGLGYFRYVGRTIASSRTDITDRPTAEDAAALVNDLTAAFARGEIDAVYVIYPNFKSVLSAPPATVQVLPVQPPETGAKRRDYILAPDAQTILGELLPLYVRNSVYRALVEMTAAFYAAQRTAMKNATDNATDMLKILGRTYNRARQATITQEIAEIVGGAAALQG